MTQQQAAGRRGGASVRRRLVLGAALEWYLKVKGRCDLPDLLTRAMDDPSICLGRDSRLLKRPAA